MEGRYKGKLLLKWITVVISICVVVIAAKIYSERAKSVTYTPLSIKEIVQKFAVAGKVEPESRAQISSFISGVVKKIYKEEGQLVKAGEVLAELDDTEAKVALTMALAGVSQAEARLRQIITSSLRTAQQGVKQAELALRQAQEDLMREKTLFASKVTSEEGLRRASQLVEQAKLNLETSKILVQNSSPEGGEAQVARAQISQAKASLDASKTKLNQTKITAAIPGKIIGRKVEIGDVVAMGRNLFTIISEKPPYVTADIDEKYISTLALGQKATFIADAYANMPVFGRLVSLGTSVNESRGTLQVRFSIDQVPDFFRSDMSLTVFIETGKKLRALVLPKNVVRDVGTSKPYVLVAEQSLAKRRDIIIGLRDDINVEIIGGIEEATTVIKDQQVRENDKVK